MTADGDYVHHLAGTVDSSDPAAGERRAWSLATARWSDGRLTLAPAPAVHGVGPLHNPAGLTLASRDVV